jgi:predicted Fe-Mo cluster-binding NifX family protein
MNIAVPVESCSNNSPISPMFARSEYFALIETSDSVIDFITNPYAKDKHRVGQNVVWMLSKKNVKALLGFEFGLKLQNEVLRTKLQLIIISNKNKSLKDIMHHINSKNNLEK